ncbi:hypothetical protein SDC9_175166 [bioreactor metagenome]|uniref:Uncharacterized protein n=1 Tax=bioreactor metagenome TaxID=1076179 RepID=A0A645GP99_9ZZZZ
MLILLSPVPSNVSVSVFSAFSSPTEFMIVFVILSDTSFTASSFTLKFEVHPAARIRDADISNTAIFFIISTLFYKFIFFSRRYPEHNVSIMLWMIETAITGNIITRSSEAETVVTFTNELYSGDTME